jgi:outer membrane protein OmpA-like peptidoglycan-associated protein/Mg-chelatase subunit ChlD
MKKMVSIYVVTSLILLAFGNVHSEELFELLTPNRLTTMTFQMLEENRLMVLVTDNEGNPVRGLKPEDFVIKKGAKKAHLLSVEPLETSEDIGLNLVLVVDNSVSMKDRKAIKPLLNALEEFFKILRPIDDVHVVVFDQKGTRRAGKWSLHTKTRHSSDVRELRDFFQNSFTTGLSAKTYLHEAIMEGLEISRQMPEKQNKLLVIFSDGEDINSAFDSAVVEDAAKKVENLKVYAIDYMKAATVDSFLKTFAESHDGKIWKASSATELLPIFKEFSTTLRYQYVIAYRFLDPPKGILNMGPADIHLETLTMLDGSMVGNVVFFENGKSAIPSWYTLFFDRAEALDFYEDQPGTALERHSHVLNYVGKRLAENSETRVCIVGCHSAVGREKDNDVLSEERAEAVKAYLVQVWGIDSDRLAIEARALPEKASPPDLLGARAENQRVEIHYDDSELQPEASASFIAEKNGIQAIQIEPDIVAEYGIAHWELRVLAGTEPVKIIRGTDTLKERYNISLDAMGRHRLAISDNLEARIKVVDAHGDVHETAAASPIVVSKRPLIHELIPAPRGSLAMEPLAITIEELTTIDSAPLLNYIFFNTGESELDERYKLFASQADTLSFDENNLKGSMEKYLHVLNILGARLKRFPDTHLTIVGCNSNYGEEKGRTDLSRSRAEAVRAYLKYIWGVEGSRMDVEVRNLPKAASANRIPEGRADNQRVELYSDSSDILDTTKSTYVQEISDAEAIVITPDIVAGYGIKQWRLDLKGDGMLVSTLGSGIGDLEQSFTFDLKQIGLGKIGLYENIMAEIVIADNKGQALKVTSPSASVDFIKRKERVSQKVGYKVLEKYALILFEYDSSEIKGRNRIIVDRIIERLKAFPGAIVRVVGHTDNIGQEPYNIELSQRRAKAVYEQMLEAGMTAGDNATYEGAGPHKPLFDNALPEGRALNRTVTVSLEYEQQ